MAVDDKQCTTDSRHRTAEARTYGWHFLLRTLTAPLVLRIGMNGSLLAFACCWFMLHGTLLSTRGEL